MKIAPFLLCAQISCALVAALDGILSEGVKVSELFDRSQLAAENGYQVGHGQKGLPKRLWRREDQQSQVEKRSIKTKQNDAPTEGAKDKWTSFSEGLNTRERWVEVEKRSGGVFKRSDKTDVFPVDVSGYEIDENVVLGFILGEGNLGDAKCKTNLGTYCDKLKKDKDLINKDPLLNYICDDGGRNKKCQELQNNVKQKVQTLKDALEKLDFNDLSKLTDKNCTDNESQCFFLEGADPGQLKDKCNGLRNACYKMRREDVAIEVLLRVLSGDLKQNGDVECKKKLEKHCPLLSQQSDELLQKCLKPDDTCKDLIEKAKAKCTELGKSVETALGKKGNDTFKDECHSLLEQCHFYDANCKEGETKCKELEKECKDKDFTYTPPDSIVNPIEQAPGFFEKIDLEALYAKSAEDGAFIGKLRELSRENFLALITPYQQEPKNYKTECEKELAKNCKNYKSFPSEIKGLCENEKKASAEGEGACTNLSNNIKNRCNNLKIRLVNKEVFENSQPSKIYTWNELKTINFRERDCAYYESQCLYLEEHCGSHDLGKGCQNLRAACYKRALYDLAYVELEKKLRGELSSINARGEPTSDQKKKLLESCQELRNQSVELFQLCIDPEMTLNLLEIDIYEKAHILKPELDHRRDFPDERDCLTLQKQCEHLETDSDFVSEACYTLKTRCQFRDLSEELKHRLLEKRDETLKNETICTHKLGTECPRWNRKRENPFSFPCALRNDSCKLMTQRVRDHCKAFQVNLEERKIAENANKPQQQEEICLQWKPYCDTLLPNCEDKNNETKQSCEKLKTNCEKFLKRWELEEELMKELQGNLNNNDCKQTLKGLCTSAKNVTDPKSSNLSSLCKEEGKNDDQVRKDLCDKLIKRIEKRCPVLTEKLEKAKNEVEKMHSEYEKIKKEAEKAFNDASVVISVALKEEEKIVRRDVKKNTESGKQEPMSVLITAKERDAIELSAQAMNLYMELKETCEPLLLDCGFKKECKECETACTTIEAKCTSIKAPEVRPPAVITKECKPGNGTEKVHGSESKPSGKSEPSGGASKPSKPEGGQAGGKEEKKCDPVKTVDKWTTTTSTYTATTTSTKTTTLKVTLTSTRKCKPTKCTTGKTQPTGGEEEEVVPSGGKRWLPNVGIAIVGVVVAVM